MNILILGNVPPGAIGGAEVQSLLLAHCWAKAGHCIVIAGPDNLPHEQEGITIISTPIFRATRLLRGISYGIATLWLLWSIRRNYDIIYCRFLKEHTFIAALAKLIFCLPQPLVSCPACSGNIGDATMIKDTLFRGILLWVFNHGVSCINAMSQNILLEVQSLGLNHARITTLPNGVVISRSPSNKVSNDLPLRIVFVGRLVNQKGLDILLEAISMQKSDAPHFEVLIIGDGPAKYELKQYCGALGLEKIVHFTGALPHIQISKQLANADLFILPSRNEGMPGALLEAIAQGLPAVVTSCGGSEAIVDESIGWVVPPENNEALAKAIASALRLGKKALQEMGKKAYQKAVRDYEITTIAKMYLELFGELLSSNSPK